MDEEGKAEIEFNTSDDTGEYIIDVEGYTCKGEKISGTGKLVVRK